MRDVSDYLVPALVVGAVLFGLVRRVPVYDAFVRGAKRGLSSAKAILPFLVAMLPALALLSASGALEFLMRVFSPVLTWVGIPEQTLPLMLLRPLSGSAALAMLERTLATVGADSYAGRAASAMLGSSETIFYTVALYLGAAGVKRSRHAIPAALAAWLAGSIAAAWACRLF